MIKKILVSQPKPANEKSPYFDMAEQYGVEFVFRPFIQVVRLSAREFRQQHQSIDGHTAVVFTSRHAIDHYFNLCQEMRYTVPEDMKYFCVTEAVSLYIQKYVQYRKRKVFFGQTGRIDDLLPAMTKHKTEKYLVPMSDIHSDSLTKLLDAKKLNHKEVVMYRTVSNDLNDEEKAAFDYDMLLFFSPAGVDALLKNIPDFTATRPDVMIGCFGNNTAKAIKDAGLRLDLQAPTEKHPSMTGALNHFLQHLDD